MHGHSRPSTWIIAFLLLALVVVEGLRVSTPTVVQVVPYHAPTPTTAPLCGPHGQFDCFYTP